MAEKARAKKSAARKKKAAAKKRASGLVEAKRDVALKLAAWRTSQEVADAAVAARVLAAKASEAPDDAALALLDEKVEATAANRSAKALEATKATKVWKALMHAVPPKRR